MPRRHRWSVFTVAATCDVCGKGPGFGNSISHSHRRTRRRWNPNIQTRARDGGQDPAAAQRLHLLHEGRQGRPGLTADGASGPDLGSTPTADTTASCTNAPWAR